MPEHKGFAKTLTILVSTVCYLFTRVGNRCIAAEMQDKLLPVCLTVVSSLFLQFTLASIVCFFLRFSVVAVLLLHVGALFLWFVVGRWLRRLLGVSYSPPAFVFFHVGLMWLFYDCFLINVLGWPMDLALNIQCFTLVIGLWRIVSSNPGYLNLQENFLKRPDMSAKLEDFPSKNMKHSLVEANRQATVGCKEEIDSCSPRSLKRAGYCKTCNAYVQRYDHHCPAFANCIGYGNHRLFLLLLGLFISCELCYFLCGISRFSSFNGKLNTTLKVSQSMPWIVSTFSFSSVQLLWQVPFLLWHVYCICTNITTDEWANWEKYPEFQKDVFCEIGQLSPRKIFTNPYNKGVFSNIFEFLSAKPALQN